MGGMKLEKKVGFIILRLNKINQYCEYLISIILLCISGVYIVYKGWVILICISILIS